MIKNERQYRITKAQADKFAEAISRVERAPSSANPLIVKASRAALESQIADLHSDIEEYERLRSGNVQFVEVESFQELPGALIRARIAAGLTQKDLGERLDMKEQQIQRYEATDYAGASFSTLSAIVKALGVSMREDILFPTGNLTVTKFLNRLEGLGLDKNFVQNGCFQETSPQRPFPRGHRRASSSSRPPQISGESTAGVWQSPSDLCFLSIDLAAAGAARFKLPARVADQRLSAYTIYAHHLSTLAIQVTPTLEPKPIPRKPSEVVEAIMRAYGELSLATALTTCGALASRCSLCRMPEHSTARSGACTGGASSSSNSRRNQMPDGSSTCCMNSGTPVKNSIRQSDLSWSFRRRTQSDEILPRKSTRACSLGT